MRLVVGPLPASVYWRRRAMVLAGLALAVLIVAYSCSNTGKAIPAAGPSSSPSAAAATQGVIAPVTEISPSPAAVSPTATVAVVSGQTCTDAELKVTAVPAKTTLATGTELQITLLIKNISNRSCNRDIGADQQELRVVLGTEKIWSSDDCDGPTGTEDRTFPPGHERSYNVIWNGKSSSACSTTAKRTPSGPAPTPGDYQLIGRVGTDLSDPVTIKLT